MLVQKTAKISSYGNPKAKTIWIALHGYGQLSHFFIRKLHVLDAEKNFVIAPEGLHRFYVKGTGGRVGASWMTKEERQIDIDDYIRYLDQVFKEYEISSYDQVVLLGFSQGAATSARWMELGNIKPDVYLHWAGVFPPDLQFDPQQNVFENSRNFYLVGNEDQYFNDLHIQSELSNFKTKGIDIEFVSFEGSHDLDSAILKTFDKELNGIS